MRCWWLVTKNQNWFCDILELEMCKTPPTRVTLLRMYEDGHEGERPLYRQILGSQGQNQTNAQRTQTEACVARLGPSQAYLVVRSIRRLRLHGATEKSKFGMMAWKRSCLKRQHHDRQELESPREPVFERPRRRRESEPLRGVRV